MKRSLTSFFAAGAVAATTVSADSCPCFTAAQYDAILAAFPGQSGCHFAVTPTDETLGSSIAYLFSGDHTIAVVQAAVTVEDMDGTLVEGGICGIGGSLPTALSVLNQEAFDYGQGDLTPEAFQDCVDIMQAKCHSTCAATGLIDLEDNQAGCGQMPTSLN
eukprot:scaffold16355_cov170-Amphora_coffeaeformis.AAC.8